MATTDARPGFKLPWSSDRPESDSHDAADTAPVSASEAPQATTEPVAAEAPVATPAVNGDTAAAPAQVEPPFDPWRLGTAPAAAVEQAPKRKPNKLMADLTRAMQSAAETARDETLARLQTDAKTFIETIHARSGSEAEELRKTADSDIAAIREWSKAEIARIREETDRKVADRKSTLESEIESHAARIEQRIERVQAHVAWFETEMAGFFERLLAEEDPTRLAAMAESLPEPPSFEDDLVDLPAPEPVAAAVEPVVDEAPQIAGDEPPADAAVAEETFVAEGDQPVDVVEAAAVAEAAPADEHEFDARLRAFGLSPEAAAEAEAEAEVNPAVDGEEIATFSDDALTARLAGLVPVEGEVPNADLRTTRVIVTGLVSVASIAGFKRHLGRIEGVDAVGVSSGPEGEFIFAVSHLPAVDLRQAVPALPGFAAQVTESTDDTVSVAARDPETES